MITTPVITIRVYDCIQALIRCTTLSVEDVSIILFWVCFLFYYTNTFVKLKILFNYLSFKLFKSQNFQNDDVHQMFLKIVTSILGNTDFGLNTFIIDYLKSFNSVADSLKGISVWKGFSRIELWAFVRKNKNRVENLGIRFVTHFFWCSKTQFTFNTKFWRNKIKYCYNEHPNSHSLFF